MRCCKQPMWHRADSSFLEHSPAALGSFGQRRCSSEGRHGVLSTFSNCHLSMLWVVKSRTKLGRNASLSLSRHALGTYKGLRDFLLCHIYHKFGSKLTPSMAQLKVHVHCRMSVDNSCAEVSERSSQTIAVVKSLSQLNVDYRKRLNTFWDPHAHCLYTAAIVACVHVPCRLGPLHITPKSGHLWNRYCCRRTKTSSNGNPFKSAYVYVEAQT